MKEGTGKHNVDPSSSLTELSADFLGLRHQVDASRLGDAARVRRDKETLGNAWGSLDVLLQHVVSQAVEAVERHDLAAGKAVAFGAALTKALMDDAGFEFGVGDPAARSMSQEAPATDRSTFTRHLAMLSDDKLQALAAPSPETEADADVWVSATLEAAGLGSKGELFDSAVEHLDASVLSELGDSPQADLRYGAAILSVEFAIMAR